MQVHTPFRYSDVVKAFYEANPRGTRVFQNVYGFSQKDAVSLLKRKEWHRWYCFKKCCHWIERHCAGTEDWVCRHFSDIGLRMIKEGVEQLMKTTRAG